MIPVSEFVTAVEAKLDEGGESSVFQSMATQAKDGGMAFSTTNPDEWAPPESYGPG